MSKQTDGLSFHTSFFISAFTFLICSVLFISGFEYLAFGSFRSIPLIVNSIAHGVPLEINGHSVFVLSLWATIAGAVWCGLLYLLARITILSGKKKS